MQKPTRLMMVDDDSTNNALCKFLIRKVDSAIETVDFTFPKKAIDYIEASYKVDQPCSTVLFLDINMPVMSGWDFLERYAEMPEGVKNQFSIYIVSSSLDLRDKQKAATNQYVKSYIEKPLSPELVLEVLAV